VILSSMKRILGAEDVWMPPGQLERALGSHLVRALETTPPRQPEVAMSPSL